MILSDADIIERLERGDLVIDPITDADQQIQPNGVDIRLWNEFKVAQPQEEEIDPTKGEGHDFIEAIDVNNDGILIRPGDFVLASSRELVEIPPDLTVQLDGRSSMGRLGITVHITAGRLDAGWRGRITLEMQNVSGSPIRLYPGMRVGQLVFEEMKSEAERPYGKERGSSYQDQTGVEESKISSDDDLRLKRV